MGKTSKIDWDKFSRDVKEASVEAAAKTDKDLAVEMASITSLTQAEILEIFPERTDMEDFSELMKIVKSGTSRNEKINKIVANSERFGNVIISLLGKVI
ncbi:hypothetical protein LB467_03200 [Salegentibacter sp. JZCK2]|uniref:hypothetical protein n=1 Tax=Salegentibacter tibetensis TaxID=2873600 RepID=UPI001CCC33AB|nr:hypothetical protein [Salegentibacter tibetensis]MBZ9728682.1 hypothetical protein [Salegentibacter tibetensis]